MRTRKRHSQSTSQARGRSSGQAVHRLLALLGVLALTASACGDSGSSSSASSDSEPDTANAADDQAKADDEESAEDGASTTSPTGTIRIGVGTNVQSYDPVMAAVAQEYYLHPVFDTLVHANSDGSYAPGLALSWEQIDATTLRLELRDGVSFSDETAFDADAVVANFERAIATEASPSAAFYANLTSVEATDGLTVELTLGRPSTSLLSDLSRLPGMMMSPASFDASPETAPVGAGGWTHDAESSNPGEIEVFQANPSYWDPSRVLVQTIEMPFYESQAATNAMLAGQVDVIELRTEADAPTFEDAGFGLISRPNANVWYIQVMDTDGSLLAPMGDARVRQALSMAIDREAFNQALQFGKGDSSASFWLEGTPYYDPANEDVAFNLDQARELLAEVGYADGFELTVPSFGPIIPVAEAIQQMWADIGVTVTIQQVEPGTLATEMRSGNYALTPTLARGFTAESHYLERLASGSPYDPLSSDRGSLGELADAAFGGTDQASQDAAWAEMYTEALLQGYLMTIGHQIPTIVVADGISGIDLGPSDNVPQPYDISVG